MADNRLPMLMLAAAGLGALLWLDIQSREAPDVVAPAGPVQGVQGQHRAAERAPGGEMVNPLAGLDKESLRDMTERPLFAATRRPPPKPAPVEAAPVFEPPPAPPPTPDYTLLGIVRDGDRAIALLRSRSEGRNLRVETGDVIGGWEIAAVNTVSVKLKGRDGAAHELRVKPR
jgi:general secretion pathway protein N